jgi:hypothetical protein
MSTLAAEATAEDAAVEAARVAFALVTSFETSERLVLNAKNFNDVHHAVRAALKAHASGRVAYRVVEMDARYSVHGTVLDDNASLGCEVDGNVDGRPGCDGRPIAAIITVKSRIEISNRAVLPVVSDLSRQVEELVVSDDTCLSLQVFIIESPWL